MSAKLNIHLASAFLSAVIATWAAFLLMIFHVPRWVAVWNDMDQTLASWKLLLVDASAVAISYSIPITALLGFFLIITVTWRVVASISYRRNERQPS